MKTLLNTQRLNCKFQTEKWFVAIYHMIMYLISSPELVVRRALILSAWPCDPVAPPESYSAGLMGLPAGERVTVLWFITAEPPQGSS